MNRKFVAVLSAASLAATFGVLRAPSAIAADPDPSAAASLAYSGSGSAHALDLTVLGTSGVHVAQAAVGSSEGSMDTSTTPRSVADASNLALSLLSGTAPSPALLAHTHQEAPPDHAISSTKTVVPLRVPGLLDLGVSSSESNARWAGDDKCLASGASVERSTVSTADAELLGVAGLTSGLLKLSNTVATAQSTRLQQLSLGAGRAVVSNAAGSAVDLSLFNGGVHVQVASAPVLTAVANGKPGGASVTWTAPLVTVNGTPLTVSNSPLRIVSPDNPLLSVELTLGTKTKDQRSAGRHARRGGRQCPSPQVEVADRHRGRG